VVFNRREIALTDCGSEHFNLKLYYFLQGVTILMMGSKEEDVPVEPSEKPLFVEDMNESELASAVSKFGMSCTCL
jgi:ubiquitin carboxyl-terminal hydrolase 14